MLYSERMLNTQNNRQQQQAQRQCTQQSVPLQEKQRGNLQQKDTLQKTNQQSSAPRKRQVSVSSSARERSTFAVRQASGERQASGARQASGERRVSGARQTAGERQASGARQASGGRRVSGARQAAGERQVSGERRSSSVRQAAGERQRRATGTQQNSAARQARQNQATNARRAQQKRTANTRTARVDLRLPACVLLALFLILVLILRGCMGSAGSNDADNSEQPVTTETSTDTEEIVFEDIESYSDQVYSLLEATYAEQLMNAAHTDADAAWIVSHIDQYAVDGSIVQYKLLKLAAVEPQARSFVRNWPEQYPSDQAESCSSNEDDRAVPRLYQWDARWGYTLYCNTTFALTGCCPTSLAMVYQGLTGASDKSPYDMGVLANERGYMDSYNGTDTAFLTNCASELGLQCTTISVSADSITSTLAAGQVIICNVGPGDFTTGGHFIVLAGLDSNGNVVVNDPFSAERSAESWSAETIASQTKALFAYSLA